MLISFAFFSLTYALVRFVLVWQRSTNRLVEVAPSALLTLCIPSSTCSRRRYKTHLDSAFVSLPPLAFLKLFLSSALQTLQTSLFSTKLLLRKCWLLGLPFALLNFSTYCRVVPPSASATANTSTAASFLSS